MSKLAETNPELVRAACAALNFVESVGDSNTWQTNFVHEGKEYWVKVTMDLHANTIDALWVFPIDDPRVGRV